MALRSFPRAVVAYPPTACRPRWRSPRLRASLRYSSSTRRMCRGMSPQRRYRHPAVERAPSARR
jgi:hypothetical protein